MEALGNLHIYYIISLEGDSSHKLPQYLPREEGLLRVGQDAQLLQLRPHLSALEVPSRIQSAVSPPGQHNASALIPSLLP